MAGEFPKRVGEIGEKTVVDFLDLIGWQSVIQNFDLDCINREKHNSKAGTHGVDGFFHYLSPMISNTLENVLISTKYSSKKYPSSIVSDFKDDFKKITSAIECFKKSDLRNNTIGSYSDINAVFDRGVIFKINNVDDSKTNIVEKLSNIEIPTENNHDGVILIDNERISFLFNSISFIKNKYTDDDIQFVYFNTGLNNNDQSVKGGKLLPFQYLASNIIPFRIQTENGATTFIICSRDPFSEDDLIKLLGVAKNSTSNFQQTTVIAFPNYNELEHDQSVAKVRLLFKDDNIFMNGITVISYNPTFRR